MNYASITCDKGFAYFEVKDKMITMVDNNFRFERIFYRLKSKEGKTVFDTATETLKRIKEICDEVTMSVKGTNGMDNKLKYEAILGDQNKDYSIRNRLLKGV